LPSQNDEEFEITKVNLQVRKDSTGFVSVGIYAVDGAGKPTGSALCEMDDDLRYLPASPDWYDFAFSAGATLSASTQYAIVVHTANTQVRMWWMYDLSDPYGGAGGSSLFDEESFEVDFGDWSSDLTQSHEWERLQGATGSSGCGPNSAHDLNYYVYVECSSAQSGAFSLGDTAAIELDLGGTQSGYVDFYYMWYGVHLSGGLLELQGYDDSQGWLTIWSITGTANQNPDHDTWLNVTQPDTSFTDYDKLRFLYTVVTEAAWSVDPALDLIKVYITGASGAGQAWDSADGSSWTLVDAADSILSFEVWGEATGGGGYNHDVLVVSSGDISSVNGVASADISSINGVG